MFQKMRQNSAGDTLVEVLLATVILSIVLAGAYSLSTRATRLNQSAYERTRATNLVQEQAELLRAVRNSADESTWLLVKNYDTTSYYDCRDEVLPIPPDVTNSAYDSFFYLNGTGTDVNTNPGTFKTTDGLYYTWVGRKDTGSNPDYIDFEIYTCWEGIGGIGNQVTGTVIRLENR